MPTVLPTKLPAILLALQAWVQSRNVVPSPDVVYITAPDPPLSNQADQYVCIWARGGGQDRPIGQGASRLDTRIRRKITAVVRTRLAVDEPYSDLAALTDTSLGHLTAEHALLDALEQFKPQDNNQNLLTYQGLRLENTSDPIKTRTDMGWTESRLDFECFYVAALDQSIL